MRRSWRSSKLNGVAMKVSMNSDRLLDRVLAGTDRDEVGVVVLARELGGRHAPDQCGASALDLVGGDLLAVARAAEDDAERLDARSSWSRTTARAALMQKLG